MVTYFAITPANTGFYLTDDRQMDAWLERGAKIYRETDGEPMTLIATPQDGYLVERPEFSVYKTDTLQVNTELEQAARILLGMEE